MRLLYGILLALLWGAAGLLVGAAFGFAFNQPLPLSISLGAAICGGLGFMEGVLTPRFRAPRKKTSQPRRGRLVLGRCAWCSGTGREPKKSRFPCRACFGRGSVLTSRAARPCPRCKGKGRKSLGRRCKNCQGAGFADYSIFERTQGNQSLKQKRAKRWWRSGIKTI